MISRFRNRRLFVTGASGFLGRHLVNADSGWEVIAPPSHTLDIRQREAVIDAIRDWKPAAVVHLAYRQDDRVSIVDATRNVAEAAAVAGARLVHMSTDVVFPGRDDPYTEVDEVFPITPYGAWKAEAEAIVAAIVPSAAIVRTSLIYGTDHHGHIERAVAAGGMTFFTDEFRCPIHAGDLAAAVSEIARRPEITGPLHVAGPSVLSRSQLAQLIARRLGIDLRRVVVGPGSIAAGRPAHVLLDSRRAIELGLRVRRPEDVLAT